MMSGSSDDFKPYFKGCMSMPLYGEEVEDMLEGTKFYQDWKTKVKRIFKKGRRFKLNFYLFDMDGDKRVHTKVVMLERADMFGLSSTVRVVGNEFVAEHNKANPDCPIDLKNSFVTARA